MGGRALGRPGAAFVPLGVAATVVLLDQVAKLAVRATLGRESPGRTIDVIGSLVVIEYAENRGAAFGLFRGQGLALSLLALAILGGLVLFYRRQTSPTFLLANATGLIGGGAVGNLIDRLRLGYVIDFIAVGRWPNFNLADAAISIGVVVLTAAMLRDDPSRPHGEPIPGGGPPATPPSSPADGR